LASASSPPRCASSPILEKSRFFMTFFST
jgi:hypothetical protein